MEKIYLSQWLKLGEPKENDSEQEINEKYIKQTKTMKLLRKEELDLLIKLVKNRMCPQYPSEEYLVFHLIRGLGVNRAIKELGDRKEGTLLRMVVTEYGIKTAVRKVIKTLSDLEDYDNLLILGRYIAMKCSKKDLQVYTTAMIKKLSKYKPGSPANPISCLICLSPETTMRVEKFFKSHNYPEAYQRWKEYRTKLGV